MTVSWDPATLSGVHHLTITRESPSRSWNASAEQEPYSEDCGLDPDTEHRYQVCAFYITEDADSECSEWTPPARTLKAEEAPLSRVPPTPHIERHDQGDTWIGVKWVAGYTYDSYYVSVNESFPGQTRHVDTIHHDDDGSWGYQRVEGLRPGHHYTFEVQGCTKSFFGILEGNCWGWSTVYFASTIAPDPRLCVSGFVWREVTPEDLVCVTPDERDNQIPNDDSQHSARSQRRFDPNSCLLTAPKSRKCYVTECIAPFVWRMATAADKTCVPPERAEQVAADNAAAPSRQIGNQLQ